MIDTIYVMGILFLSLIYFCTWAAVFLGDSLYKISKKTPLKSNICRKLVSFADYFWRSGYLGVVMLVLWPAMAIWPSVLFVIVAAAGVYGVYTVVLELVQRLP